MDKQTEIYMNGTEAMFQIVAKKRDPKLTQGALMLQNMISTVLIVSEGRNDKYKTLVLSIGVCSMLTIIGLNSRI